MRRAADITAAETVVQLRGRVADDLVDYARQKVAGVLTHTRPPAHHSRVRVVRHGDPGRACPVNAQINVDLDGRLVRVQVEARTPREAVDRLVDRLDHRLERLTQHWETRRGRVDQGRPREWRHGFPATRRKLVSPRPPQQREIVRHKLISAVRCSVDEAVRAMDDLDYDFHLFVEASRGVDSIVYRAGPTGVRLAQVDAHVALVAPDTVAVTASTRAAPQLALPEALTRLRLAGTPFLFYLDADHQRGCVLYRRYDGHYGLIDPLHDG